MVIAHTWGFALQAGRHNRIPCVCVHHAGHCDGALKEGAAYTIDWLQYIAIHDNGTAAHHPSPRGPGGQCLVGPLCAEQQAPKAVVGVLQPASNALLVLAAAGQVVRLLLPDQYRSLCVWRRIMPIFLGYMCVGGGAGGDMWCVCFSKDVVTWFRGGSGVGVGAG